METKTNKHFILHKFATRSRPEKFFTCLDNIINRATDKENMAILVSADMNDTSMFNPQVVERLKPYVESGVVIPIFGESKSKIDAINRDMNKISSIDKIKDWSILCNVSDDMEFIVDGYDEIIRNKFNEFYPNLDGNLHFNDGFTGDRVVTMSIMGRKYYERFNYIYHPSYISLWCDNEYTEVARILNKIAYFPTPIYRHNHPANVKGLHRDAQLIQTESFYQVDGNTYNEKKIKEFLFTSLKLKKMCTCLNKHAKDLIESNHIKEKNVFVLLLGSLTIHKTEDAKIPSPPISGSSLFLIRYCPYCGEEMHNKEEQDNTSNRVFFNL